jgi:3-oxoacyl-[acyl-carrier-protein] synthase II
VTTPVWITGVGTCTPLGDSYQQFADNLLAGKCGIGRVEGFPIDEHPSQVAGQVARVPCPPEADPERFAGLHRLEQLVWWCCSAALRNAGLWERRRSLRVGLALGMGAEWLLLWEAVGLQHSPGTWQPAVGDTSLVLRAA